MLKSNRRAAVLIKNASIEIQDREHTKLNAGEVEVSISRAGICSSDIERGFNHGAYHYPLVMGHELAGTVKKTKSVQSHFENGDRVAIFPLLPCFDCSSCERKFYALCKKYSYYGSRVDGGFASHLNCCEWNLMKLPDKVSMDDAALVEPTAVVIHAVKKLGINASDRSICIIGAGFLGLLAVMYIRQEFPQLDITLIDRNDTKIRIGEDLGANGFQLRNEEDWDEFISKNVDSYSKVIEFIGAPETFCNSIALCEQGGTVVWVGNIRGDVSLPEKMVSSILRKELTILGSWNSFYKSGDVCDWTEAISLMSKGFQPSKLVSTRIGIEELNDTLRKLHNHKARKSKFVTTKVMVELRE
jgi:L-iditol 2-dehydrogenase